MAGSFKHGNKLSVFIKERVCLIRRATVSFSRETLLNKVNYLTLYRPKYLL